MLSQAAAADSKYALTFVDWRSIAPPEDRAGFNATNPGDPAYDWGSLDDFVIDVRSQGLEPILTVERAPSWAEGANRPAGATPGTWKPQPSRLKEFATAIASRYSGTFTDRSGRSLPQVRYFQAWGEPNLPAHLTPQWAGKQPVGAEHYRAMLTAFNAGVKAAQPRDTVITGGTAPYGDAPGGERTRPLEFWRVVFCLTEKGKRLVKVRCAGKAAFDVLSHHPINTSGPPQQSAVNPDDISSPDMDSLRRVLKAAEKRKTIAGGRHPLWATEFWWSSKPPDDAAGVPPARQARYIEQTLYLLWGDGVSTAVNLRLRDGSPGDLQPGTGLYFKDGRAKPALTAFRFPFVADRQKKAKGRVRLWGLAPGAGRVQVQERRGKKWQRLTVAKAKRGRVFTKRVRLKGRATLRARVAGDTSLPWKLK